MKNTTFSIIRVKSYIFIQFLDIIDRTLDDVHILM